MNLNIYRKIFQKGILIDEVEAESFKDFANIYFRRYNKNFVQNWNGNFENLTLKYDDRLDKFFLYKDYDPVVGFYFYNQTIQIVQFHNEALYQAVSQLIDFAKKLAQITTDETEEMENQ